LASLLFPAPVPVPVQVQEKVGELQWSSSCIHTLARRMGTLYMVFGMGSKVPTDMAVAAADMGMGLAERMVLQPVPGVPAQGLEEEAPL